MMMTGWTTITTENSKTIQKLTNENVLECKRITGWGKRIWQIHFIVIIKEWQNILFLVFGFWFHLYIGKENELPAQWWIPLREKKQQQKRMFICCKFRFML